MPIPWTSRRSDFADLLVTLAAWSLAVATIWAVVVLGCALLEAITDSRHAWTRFTGCPPAWRIGLVAALAAVLVGATPANARIAGPGPGDAARVEGLPLPDRPVGAAPDASSQPSRPVFVTVRAGDSLWRLSKRHLAATARPSEPPDAQVAGAVRRLYTANRDVIGMDPDLIRPGQRLVLPPDHGADGAGQGLSRPTAPPISEEAP